MIVTSRIDSRLIHGQVVEAWVPHLKVARLVVADDTAAGDPLAKVAFGLAVPPGIELVVAPVEQVDFGTLASDGVRTLVLFRDVRSAVAGRAAGLPTGALNVGNVHAGPGRVAVSRSVFLDDGDVRALAGLRDGGMAVSIQAVPTEAPQALPA